MDFIDKIIFEEANKFITENINDNDGMLTEEFSEKIKSILKKINNKDKVEIMNLFHKYKSKYKTSNDKENLRRAVGKYKKKKEKEKEGKPEMRTKKLKGGGRRSYDFSNYKEKHRKVSSGDFKQLAGRIDTEKTNIAAIGREIYPDHTKQGAQSQIEKVINGDRPMPKDVANQLEDMIASGQIALKK